MKPYLLCISGATAVGKTAVAIRLAEAFKTEILSTDSRQFYKEMSIGTAVPSKDELAAVPHHFIQHRTIFEPYTVGQFERDALSLLERLFQKYTLVVLVGGSGLYTRAVLEGLDEFPDCPSKIREDLNSTLQEEGIQKLRDKLQQLDPVYFKTVDLDNPHRLIRALEVAISSGKPYSSFLGKAKKTRNFIPIHIGLQTPRDNLYQRIEQRVDQMVANGLFEEAKVLHPHKALNALQTVGYREIFEYFEGSVSREAAIEKIKTNTRRFAKRQGTWYRKQEEIQWFDRETEVKEIIEFVKGKMQ